MAIKYLCGTPKDCCGGVLTQTTNGLLKAVLTHATSEEAFNCYAKHLVKQGYKKVGPREFQDPKTGYVLVLTKKSKFGGQMRLGKVGDTGSKGNRFVPKKGGKGAQALGGLIF